MNDSERTPSEVEALIALDGASFSSRVTDLRRKLGSLPNEERVAFRNANALAISQVTMPRLLVVAGPGAGKSHLFIDRIAFWLAASDDGEVCVSSFVRKLIFDLRSEVAAKVSDDHRDRVTVNTLHGIALGILNRSHGAGGRSLRAPIQIITGLWTSVVWQDVLQFHPGAHVTWSAFEDQLHREEESNETWAEVRGTYQTLSTFYNAVGFADLVVMAREAIEADPSLNRHSLWIIDEFQDFNASEEHLIRALTEHSAGVLLAGDDHQALYQKLKSSMPEIIISYYDDPKFGNAMLPFCSRCGYHICMAASHFIVQRGTEGSIEKVYLPLKVEPEADRVNIVATNTPTAAVDYIAKFLEDHVDELATHEQRMQEGKEADPFLLILTPDKKLNFFRLNKANKSLKELVARWKPVPSGRSRDYRMVATFHRAGRDSRDNFALRKVLDYRNVTIEDVHPLLSEALERGCDLSEVPADIVREAVTAGEAAVAVLDNGDLSAGEKVDGLASICSIGDRESLARELDDYPLGSAAWDVEQESEEVIETAGAMAAVELLSIVGSKGLSAEHVIILGCDDVNLGKTSDLTFFVGLTRARGTLHILVSTKAGGSSGPHEFVMALPEEHCRYVVYKKTGRVTEALPNAASFRRKLQQWARARERRR